MIEAESLEALQKLIADSKTAVKKAFDRQPRIRTIETGRYEVQGTSRLYMVSCGRKPNGALWMACSCRAGLEGKVCYHVAATFGVHVAQKRAEKEIKALKDTESPYLKKDSGAKTMEVGKIRI